MVFTRKEVAGESVNASGTLRREGAEFGGGDARAAGASRAQQARADFAQRERAAGPRQALTAGARGSMAERARLGADKSRPGAVSQWPSFSCLLYVFALCAIRG